MLHEPCRVNFTPQDWRRRKMGYGAMYWSSCTPHLAHCFRNATDQRHCSNSSYLTNTRFHICTRPNERRAPTRYRMSLSRLRKHSSQKVTGPLVLQCIWTSTIIAEHDALSDATLTVFFQRLFTSWSRFNHKYANCMACEIISAMAGFLKSSILLHFQLAATKQRRQLQPGSR